MIGVRDLSVPIGVRKPTSHIWIKIIESPMPSVGEAAISKVILISGVVEFLVGEIINLGIS